eukprot:Pgem_evm1s4159
MGGGEENLHFNKILCNQCAIFESWEFTRQVQQEHHQNLEALKQEVQKLKHEVQEIKQQQVPAIPSTSASNQQQQQQSK